MSARRRRGEKRQLPEPTGTPESVASSAHASDTIDSVELAVSFQGPLPPPRVLAQYNEALPGCAERIVSMAEQQAAHRRELETRVVESKLVASARGQTLAFILGLLALTGGVTLVALDKDLGGLTTIIAALSGLTSVFVYGRRKESEERKQKRADNPVTDTWQPPPAPPPRKEDD